MRSGTTVFRIGPFVCLFLTFVLIGCGPAGTAPRYETASTSDRPATAPQTTDIRQERKLRFLNSVREADPQYQAIERALMNEHNELGVILTRNVVMDDIPKLMRALLKRMASEFPGQDLTIIAYAPSAPPLKIGTARLDARSREMTYTPAQQQRNAF